MKTASLPSVRVEPALRQAAEDVLRPGETLSSFVEQSIRDSIRRRALQQEFIARGLQAREDARTSGEYFTAEAVSDELEAMLTARESGPRSAA